MRAAFVGLIILIVSSAFFIIAKSETNKPEFKAYIYPSGEPVKKGDIINYYGFKKPLEIGTVICVLDECNKGIFSPKDKPENYKGFMVFEIYYGLLEFESTEKMELVRCGMPLDCDSCSK
jgi:hypothetical protein